MAELGGITKYLYWSERRTQRFLEDNNLRRGHGQFTVGVPSMPLLPKIEYASPNRQASRPEIAKLIEGSIGQRAITSFDTPGQASFVKGVGTVIFGEFVDMAGERQGICSIFTESNASNGTHAAICLFGSTGNFADQLKDAEFKSRGGWTSSSAPEIKRFLEEDCQKDVEFHSRADLARYVLDISVIQGAQGQAGDEKIPWKRGFTYGDVQDVAEWFAEIYWDVDVESTYPHQREIRGFTRILIGAPLWIRTPAPNALRIYENFSEDELDQSWRERDPARLRSINARQPETNLNVSDTERKRGNASTRRSRWNRFFGR